MTGTPADSGPTWEQVLASFEASADHAESLLSLDVEARTAAQDTAPAVVAYDVWQLGLPPLPEHLRAQAEAIRRRHDSVAERLRGAMRDLRHQQVLSGATTTPRQAMFTDRRL
jgi:hypothetical protein